MSSRLSCLDQICQVQPLPYRFPVTQPQDLTQDVLSVVWAVELSFAFAQSGRTLGLHVSGCVLRVLPGQRAPNGSCSFNSDLTGPASLGLWE